METVYLETSFLSYLVSRPSRDLIVAAHQQLTSEWWQYRRPIYRRVISQEVIDEASRGDSEEVVKRLAVTDTLPLLEQTTDVDELAMRIRETGIFPKKSLRDAMHIALTSVHSIKYLLTWNCKHLANPNLSRRIEKICHNAGYGFPVICTPMALLGDDDVP